MSDRASGDKPRPHISKAPVPLARDGMGLAINLVGDKWVLLILRELFYGVRRFADMEADLGIPRAVLAERLKRMVADDLVSKEPYREKGARTRHEYVMTPRAVELKPLLSALTEWGDRHLREGPPPLEFVDKATLSTARVRYVSDEGTVLGPGQIGARLTGAKH